MSELKNVIIVNDFNYVQGGASKVAIQTANLLKENNPNLNIYFFSGDSKKDTILRKDIINISTNQGECLKDKNKIRGIKNGIYNKTAKRKLKDLLASLDNKETVIHVHGWTKCLSSSIFDIAHEMNFELVLTMHDYFTACPNGGYFNYKKNEICALKPMCTKCIMCNCDSRNYLFKIYRLLRQRKYNKSFKNLKNVIAVSDFSLNILKETLKDEINIKRINNPIDVELKQKNVEIKKGKYYLYIGRISQEKGVDLFCKVLSELNLPGVVVGDGDQKQILEDKYPNIKFEGWKNQNDLKKYMENAKCLIFPSRCYETMGLTVIEAYSYGLPAFVYKKTAAKDYVENSEYLFDGEEQLKKKIKNYEKNIDNVKNIKFNFKKYTNEYYTSEIMNLYDELIKR